MDISKKIQEWKQLKEAKKTIEKRVAALRKDILTELGPFPGKKDYGIELQVRDLTTYREDMVYNVMHTKNIPLHLYTKAVIDETKIEELYLNGDLTDDDLRQIRDPRYVYALIESDVEDV